MPDWSQEEKLSGLICGVDEAGRGPWAGPVVAGAVVFYTRQINPELLNNLNDSKKLSAKKRDELYRLLEAEKAEGNLDFAVGEVSAAEIDKINILQATFAAMRQAVAQLSRAPDWAIIDGNKVPAGLNCRACSLVKGDAKSFSVAAASIVAKVRRDRLMTKLAQQYPGYGFEKNAGYGTKEHITGLKKLGITPQHRKTYKPIARLINPD